MNARRSGIRFLVFVVLTVLLTGAIAAAIQKFSFDDSYALTAEFEDVTGLFLGDAVRIAGVEIGKVSSIEVESGRAVIELQINAAHDIPDDSSITVSWLNLVGQRQVDITAGTSATFFSDGAEVTNTVAVTDLGSVADQLGPFARVLDPAQINELLETIFVALQGRESDVAALATDVALILQTLAERDATLDGLITDYSTVAGALAQRDEQIRTMLDNLLLIAETFADNDDVLAAALDDAGVLSEQLNGFLQRNETTLGQLVADLAVITDTAADRIDTLDAIVRNLPAATRDLFTATRRGEFLNMDMECLQFSLPPCTAPSNANTGASSGEAAQMAWLMFGRGS